MLPSYPLTSPSVLTFIIIPIALVVALTWGTSAAWRRAGESEARAQRAAWLVGEAALAWMALTWILAVRGVLMDFERQPPPFAWLVGGVLVLAAIIAFSRIGTRLAKLPLWILIGVQSFRLPLELAMHRLAERGVMPEQMSYSGRNFDIVSGATALIVAALLRAGYGGRALAAVWNVIGLALLVNIVTVAILSTPAVAYFGPERLNTFVFHPPFVWLPAVMVLAALAGHLVIFRALRQPTL
jgi:hypothetical protein